MQRYAFCRDTLHCNAPHIHAEVGLLQYAFNCNVLERVAEIGPSQRAIDQNALQFEAVKGPLQLKLCAVGNPGIHAGLGSLQHAHDCKAVHTHAQAGVSRPML